MNSNTGLLSQWRGYAGGSGFAIEFDEDALDELVKSETSRHAYFGFRTGDVFYQDYEKKMNAVDFSGIASAIVRDAFADKGVDISPIAGARQIDEIVEPFMKLAPFLKDEGFKEEREYRLAAVCFRGAMIAQEDVRPPKTIKLRSRNGLVTPYIELFEGGKQPLPLRGVIIGPHPRQQEQRFAVEILLEQTGTKVPVRLLSTSYRG